MHLVVVAIRPIRIGLCSSLFCWLHERHAEGEACLMNRPLLKSCISLFFFFRSIGSLGDGGSYGHVSNVLVENVTLSDVTVGLRIKTYQGGTGVVHDVVYRDVAMQNVGAALVIDQVWSSAHIM